MHPAAGWRVVFRLGREATINTYTLPHNVRFSAHALQRMSQRGISRQRVAYTLLHGKRIRRGDATAFYLRRRDIRPEDRRLMDRAAGLIVVFDEATGELVSVYWATHPPRKAPWGSEQSES